MPLASSPTVAWTPRPRRCAAVGAAVGAALLAVAAGVASVACTPAHRIACATCAAAAKREADAGSTAPVVPASRGPEAALPRTGPRALPPSTFLLGAEPLVVAWSDLPGPRWHDGAWRPVVVSLPGLEAMARDEARLARRRDVASVYAFGAAFPVAASPARFADAVLDAAAEEAALSADEVVEVGRSAAGARAGRALRIALLRMGQGPFRFDFRWTLDIGREDLPDGRVLLRYDLDEGAARERVSMFRGAAVVEPTPAGCFVREVLLLASPSAPPFFLKGRVRGASEDILRGRWSRLAARAAGG